MGIEMVFILMVIFQFKHFFADYPLQGKYMLGKFKGGTEWILPLLLHCSVHAAFTLLICLWINPALWWLCFLDLTSHFIMDRIKASPNLLGKFKVEQRQFWINLGIDQLVHHLSDILIVWLLFIL